MDVPGPFTAVEKILGIKATSPPPDLDSQGIIYFAKWEGKSYAHCTWIDRDELLQHPGGDRQLSLFLARARSTPLTESLSLSGLLTFADDDFCPGWLAVDRIIAHDGDHYLVKWCGLEYDECSWEDEADISDKAAIARFRERDAICCPAKLWGGRRSVNPKEFRRITDPRLPDYQNDGINWLRQCWFRASNSILADEPGLRKRVQVVAVLRDLSASHKIRGPFLVVGRSSSLQHWKSEIETWSDLYAVVYFGSSAHHD
jgi:hypothetical protein